jgi:threonine 3-dehydrogenase
LGPLSRSLRRWLYWTSFIGVRALVKTSAAPGLDLVEVPVPDYGINDVLIKILKSGICGTDLHIDTWDTWAQSHIRPGLVVGHEFVGEVVAIGSNVIDFHLGQIVSGEGHLVCGRCRNCMAGRRHLCANTAGVGVDRAGSFAEYISLPMTNVWVHHPGIDLEIAAIFDPFGNATHCALAFKIFGEDVLITGAGPIGCMAAAIAKHAGARHVVVTDINPYRLDLAKTMGATLAVDTRTQPLADVQLQLGMTEGFDVGMEMSGNPNALNEILGNLAHGGKAALLGLFKDDVLVDWNSVILDAITLRGIYGREMYESWYEMSVMIQSGLDISPVITHRFDISKYQEAFSVARSGDCGKVIMDWSSL